MSRAPGRRAARTAALVVSVVGTVAQAAAHLAVSASSAHAGHSTGTAADGRMVSAHVLAAVLAAAVLVRRGAALRRLARLLDGLLPVPRPTSALPPLDLGTPASATAEEPVLVGQVLATARRRRGPPAGAPLRPATA